MRKRIRDERQTTQCNRTDVPGGFFQSDTSAGWRGKLETIEDEPHPDFAARRKRGEVVMGDLKITKTERTVSPATLVFGDHPIWGSRTVYGDVCGYILVDGTIEGADATVKSMQDYALIEAYAKIRDVDVQASETYADLPKTYSQLKTALAKFNWACEDTERVVRKIKRMKLSLGAKAKMFANVWLALRYALTPIMADISKAMELCERATAPAKPARLVVRSGTQLTFKKDVAVVALPPGNYQVEGIATFQRKVVVSAGVIFRVDDLREHKSPMNTLGLSGHNALNVGYQLTPFSFVADWFVGVGSWIQAMTPVPGVTVLGNWTTTVDENNNSFRDLVAELTVYSPPITTYKAYVPPSPTKSTTITRKVNLPVPSHPALVPNFLSLKQKADACALLTQQISSVLRRLR